MVGDYVIWVELAILLFLSAFFSATETAFTSLNMLSTDKLSKEKLTGFYVNRIMRNKRRLIITVLIGNNIVNILISVLSATLFVVLIGDSGIAIVTGVLTFVLLLVGEIIPKTYAQTHNDKIARIASIPIYYLEIILVPAIWFFEQITALIFFRQRNKIRELFGDPELATALNIGVSQKAFTEEEKNTILRFLRIDDTPARKVMTPLDSVFMLESDVKVKDALPHIKQEGFSRVPLFDDTKSNITGFIHIKDVSELTPADEDKSLYLFSRGVIKVSDARTVSDIFKEMLKFHTHIAVVVKDEDAVGIVTFEDVLEEFIGEIYDETDKVTEDNIPLRPLQHSGRRQYVVDAHLPILQVEQLIQQALPKRKHDETLGEMIASFMGDIKTKKGVTIDGTIFRVMSVENGQITKVKIVKK